MSGLRRGARAFVTWCSALYVVAIVLAVFLAGEGIFRLKNVANSDDCSKKGVNVATTDCVGNSNSLDAHRGLGTILAFFAIIFLIAALIAWLPDVRTRVVSIVTPVLTFLQVVLAAIGGWVGGLHPVNAFLVLFLFLIFAFFFLSSFLIPLSSSTLSLRILLALTLHSLCHAQTHTRSRLLSPTFFSLPGLQTSSSTRLRRPQSVSLTPTRPKNQP